MAKSSKFGTFGGVFTPSILTILGVIMYLRLPMIIGEAGMWATIGIIVIAHIISTTTGLSVSSIATDKKVKAGGTYYMISRSLGLPIGGTLGLALFVGLSFSVSLYLIGFAESFLSYWEFDTSKNAIRLAGTVVLIIVTTITFISTSLAIKSQYFIMALIILSLLSIFTGLYFYVPEASAATAIPTGSTVSLMVLFGIFFPAVTGFEAGVSMSGDLKDPKSSIPKGSIAAIVVGFVVYIGLTILFSNTVGLEELAADPQILFKISWKGWLVALGIWGATLSSALGSILGAPRILQATAVDKIAPKLFAKGVGAGNEPRNAVLLTFVIAEAGILIGELDVIARIVSIFFITTYGFLNLSAAFEKWTSADFRPGFKVPIWVSLLGAAACIIVMIQLDFLALIGATCLLGLLFIYLKRKELTLESGDAWSGVWASLVKRGLENLTTNQLHSRNWRPNIIMFSGKDYARPHLEEMGKTIAGKLGILSSFELIESNETLLTKPTRNLKEKKEEEAGYFVHTHKCKDIYQGIDEISRVYGFSGIEPNTILMGWSKTEKNKEKFADVFKNFKNNDYNSVFLDYDIDKKYGKHQSIDIWWDGSGRNLSFAINLIRHVTTESLWKDAVVRLMVINHDNTMSDKIYKLINKALEDFRVDIKIKLINNGIDKLPEADIIKKESLHTDLIVLGIPESKYNNSLKTVDEVKNLLEILGTTLIINAASTFEELYIGIDPIKQSSKGEENQLNELVLPAIIPSQNILIAKDIEKIDENGNKVLQAFYDKAFLPVFNDRLKALERFRKLSQSVVTSLNKAATIKDTYRKDKAVVKTENDFLYQAAKQFEEIRNKTIIENKEVIESGIEWYSDKIASDINKFPIKLKVDYPRDHFSFKAADTFGLKLFKLRKRLGSLFSRKPIGNKIKYRELANYFLNNNRHTFLNAMLKEFETSSLSHISGLRAIITTVTDQVENIEKKVKEGLLEEDTISVCEKEIFDKIDALEKEEKKLMALYRHRFLLEFRKNLQIMGGHLEKIDINNFIDTKKKAKKQFLPIIEDNKGFADMWHHNSTLIANGGYLDLRLLAVRNRTKENIKDYDKDLSHEIERKYRRNLSKLSASLNELMEQANDGPIKLKFEPNEDINMVNGFIEKYDEITNLIKELPDSIDIISDQYTENEHDDHVAELDAASIPVERIADHFIESKFSTQVQKRLKESSELLRNSNLTVQEIVRLSNFNLENIAEAESLDHEKTNEIKDILKNALKVVNDEEEKINELNDGLSQEILALLSSAFEPLSSYVIVKNSGEFVQQARDYKSKKVISKVGLLTEKAKQFVNDKFISLLYRRSEGVILAKEMTEDKKNNPVIASVLDLSDTLSPKTDVLEKLPFFYKNLFSGKSSISEDFWIDRPYETNNIDNAITRYRSGANGAIVILGERNSGKTSLSKFVMNKYFANDKSYQIFAPKEGTIDVAVFEETLRKATDSFGSLPFIMQSLPLKSVMVIHDLELWWERSPNGMKVISTIMSMINRYSEKCLFIVNTNPFTFELINRLYKIEDNFIAAINCRPFGSEEIKDLIMLRHKSSGMKFSMGKQKEESLSGWRLAKLFHNYFRHSLGNPGVALNGWLSNIHEVAGKTLVIQSPKFPDKSIISKLDDDWKIYILQFILHKRLDKTRLMRILSLNWFEINEHLQSLLRAGIIEEIGRETYSLNEFIEPLIISEFKESEIL